ncbi:hypothetical protein LX36DRAFT_198005 [Colletotrichum falcatum]|nr:hypothetical protein LX36DRAFT_198005 [Colletotrichum falcatum]
MLKTAAAKSMGKKTKAPYVNCCLHFDDLYDNCRSATGLGRTAQAKASRFQIRRLRELRMIYPYFFTSTDAQTVSSPRAGEEVQMVFLYLLGSWPVVLRKSQGARKAK